jgi:D-sedoheptulose 7-phosphate isomerase
MNKVLSENIQEAAELFETLHALGDRVTAAAELIAAALKAGNKLLACGNGGSAADAAHMTTEFVCRYNGDRRPYPAVSFASNGGDLTAIGNDYSFEDLFARQVDAFARPGDVLIVFTTSGKSPNVIKALQAARRAGIKSIAMLGRDGGKCTGLADIELIVTSPTTARIQEAHKLLLHTMCELVDIRLGHAPARS